MPLRRSVFLISFCAILVLSACAVQRSKDAQLAQTQMVGMTPEQVFTCMGPPTQKATVGTTEIWTYNSGNNQVNSTGLGGGGHFGGNLGSSQQMFCTVNVVMNNSRVTKINYNGPSGGVFTPNEECDYAVANCVTKTKSR